VSAHYGAPIDTQIAPAAAQAAALRDVGVVNITIVAIALLLSLWGLAEERRTKTGVPTLGS
jgi:hypothetical protein